MPTGRRIDPDARHVDRLERGALTVALAVGAVFFGEMGTVTVAVALAPAGSLTTTLTVSVVKATPAFDVAALWRATAVGG